MGENVKLHTDVEPNSNIEVLSTLSNEKKIKKLYSYLAIPSYVHAYSLAIQYMYNWFESKFEKDYFVGGIYVDGKHVLDDYKNKFSKLIVKGQQPRARIEPKIQYDYDRDGLDNYIAPVSMFYRKSNLDTSFFKDYDRDIFLGINLKALRMDFNFKVRVNTRAEQLDIAQRMELYCRIGSTQYEYINADFHVPKDIILNIANRAGFEIKHGEVVDIISFLEYLNRHSELPFLFKIRAINQKAEFFIRMSGLYTHISALDKLQLDDGDRNGKLDFYYHVEMNATLTIPIPQFYSYYSCSDLYTNIELKEPNSGCIALYSIAVVDFPDVDEHGWMQAAITDYYSDEGETEIDISSIFKGENLLSKAINNDLLNGVSPSHFINLKIYKETDTYKEQKIKYVDWNTKIIYFDNKLENEIYHIVIYYDREYINELSISLDSLNDNRVSK